MKIREFFHLDLKNEVLTICIFSYTTFFYIEIHKHRCLVDLCDDCATLSYLGHSGHLALASISVLICSLVIFCYVSQLFESDYHRTVVVHVWPPGQVCWRTVQMDKIGLSLKNKGKKSKCTEFISKDWISEIIFYGFVLEHLSYQVIK
jgi:hypothetical protein